MPAIAPNIPEPSCIVAISHPTNAPLMTRAESPMACVREGVSGSTSTTYSPTAATARTIPQMPPRTSNTAATGVKVRNPETKPRPRASKRAVTPSVLPGCARRIDEHSRGGSSQTQFHARPTVDCPANVRFGSLGDILKDSAISALPAVRDVPVRDVGRRTQVSISLSVYEYALVVGPS